MYIFWYNRFLEVYSFVAKHSTEHIRQLVNILSMYIMHSSLKFSKSFMISSTVVVITDV